MRAAVLNRERAPVGINLTPMIDVSFLLIIFFIVSSHLAQQEVQQAIDLPRADSGHPLADPQRQRVIVNVDAHGELTVGGQSLSTDELQQRLAAERARVGDDLEVRIRSARDVPYSRVEPILLACSRANIWKVTFAVFRNEGR